ncbi:transient receptor potential channel pyrexia [Leguminivora glycinivorella]|uniref:transient receptor potential channel pyrexia n=1 Tax=Leguminivora glycinivorella TaxID=1035111 RepID=UPI00200C8B71|nr:transient receptor potential channel pyrexia [Leguminivora glycinivorella]
MPTSRRLLPPRWLRGRRSPRPDDDDAARIGTWSPRPNMDRPRLSRVLSSPPLQNQPQDEETLERAFPSMGHLEYVSYGSSPPAESAPNMYDSFEEPPLDLTAHICAESIRQSAHEQMRAVGGRLRLLDELESGVITVETAIDTFTSSTEAEKNVCLFWTAFLKLSQLLPILVEAGADPIYCDALGLSPLHVAAFSGSTECANFLLSRGVDPNYMPRCFAPLHCAAFGDSVQVANLLISRGASVHSAVKYVNCEGGLLHCAVRANSVECLKLFISHGVDVNLIEPGGTNAIHLAADLGMLQCLAILLDTPGADPKVRTRVGDRESTALHLAADGGFVECVDLLLSKGADASLKNHRGFTALHLAARAASLECVESLLRQGKADPNANDFDNRTPLHAAIGKCDSACDIIETLISWGANVNKKDEYGFTPLHLAALDGLSACVETLIYHGADVTTRSKKGNSALNVIARKTPASLAMITRKLDCAITLHHSQTTNREVELELDFRSILQHCYPREISYLNTFVDEGQKEVLLHPLCSAFLYIKWEKIRKYYIARLFLSFIFVLCLTLYVLTALAHNCYNGSKDMEETIQEQELCQKQSILGDLLRKNPFVIEMQWWVLAGITIFEIFRKVYGIAGYSTVKQYLMQSENIIEWFVIISVFLISYIYTNITYTWQNHIGAFAVLAGWTNLMMMIGQLPVFGTYVAMYQKVQKEFAKLLMAYSCILVGFTISFCVIFPDSSSFANPFMGFITVLTMMIGELNLDLLLNEPDGNDPPLFLEFSAQITYVLFLLFVTVVLMNLLVGIAVHDIQGLRKTAGLSKLVRQTKLISYMELALFNGYMPKCLLKILHASALVSPQAYRVVLSVKPLNPSEKRLPRDIMMAAYDIAKMRKQYGHTISSNGSTTGAYSCFKRYENNNDSSYREYGYSSGYTGLGSLQVKLDETSENVRQLTQEVRELKNLISAQQLVIQQALAVTIDSR